MSSSVKESLFPLEIKKKILREKSGELIANLETSGTTRFWQLQD